MAETTSFMLLVLLGTFIIQCHISASETPKSQKDLNQDLNNHLKKISEYVRKTFDAINKLGQDLKSQLNNNLEQLTTKIYNDIDNKIDSIEKLTKEAEENGKDVSECNSEALPKILPIREYGREELEKCYSKVNSDISETVNKYQNSLPDADAIVTKLNNKFLDCKNSTCQRQVIYEASDKLTSVQLEVGRVLGQSTLSLIVTSGKGRNCMENVPIATAIESENIFKDFIECVRRS